MCIDRCVYIKYIMAIKYFNQQTALKKKINNINDQIN